MRRILREVHGRSMWQVVLLYVGISWVVLQVAEHVVEQFGLPPWTYGAAVLLLLIGLPIVAGTAFVQRGAPGIQRATARPFADPAVPETVAPGSEAAAASTSGAATAGASDAPDGTAAAGSGAHHRLFTWKNAFLGGAAAFALLGGATGAYLFMRSAGIGPAATLVAQGVLEERTRVILADFEAPSGQDEIGRTVTEAFRIDIAQSPVVRLAEPRIVTAALRRMERNPETPLTEDVAIEVAIREGIPVAIAGDISAAGSGYLLSARVISTDGAELVAHRETARDDDELLDAIDRLSKRIRERIGEPLGSLGADRPLGQVTTGSLEALQKYSQAEHTIDVAGELERGASLLEEAIELDSEFAMAHRKLGVALFRLGRDRDRQVEAFTRAFEHRDRLTDVERYMTIGTYYTYAVADIPEAINAYETLLEIQPDNPGALNNIGILYGWIGEEERQIEMYQRSIDRGEADPLIYTNVLFPLVELGRADEAASMLDDFDRRFPENTDRFWFRGQMAAERGDYEEADRQFVAEREAAPGRLPVRAESSGGRAAVAGVQGRISEAEAHRASAERSLAEAGDRGSALAAALVPVAQFGFVIEDGRRARDALDDALSRYPLDEISPEDRPYLALVFAHATAGEPERAAELLAEWEAEVPEGLRNRPFPRQMRSVAEGAVAMAEGRWEDATRAIRAAGENPCKACPLAALARSYDAAGQRDSAIAIYERRLETPQLLILSFDETELGPTLERLGQLHDEQGDLEKALEYYARFVELWSDADPVLQPRVAAAQARIQAIVEARG